MSSIPDQVQSRYVEVAVPSSTRTGLTYELPSNHQFEGEVRRGSFVRIEVRGRAMVGIVLQETARPSFKCKLVLGLIYGAPHVPELVLQLLEWVSGYYLCPLPRLIQLCAPGSILKAANEEKRKARLEKSASFNSSEKDSESQHFPILPYALRGEFAKEKAPTEFVLEKLNVLAPEQQLAFDTILQSKEKNQNAILLEGITGSGKTEVYLALASEILKRGKSALILVPEIALTPQMTRRFRAIFGNELAVLHSGLTALETEREWYRIVYGQARVVLGVRRGIFVPLQNLGLVIVDEEHDSSYKSDDFPCIHARDVAVKRAAIEGALCVLGSASPSIETYANVKQGKYGHVTLKHRQRGQSPQIEVFDSGNFHKSRAPKVPERSSVVHFDRTVILPQIVRELDACKKRGEQSMIIVNRRGFANFSLCLDCGEALQCPRCAVTTTLHQSARTEICHHCGFKTPLRKNCTKCHSTRLENRGFGTQMVEEEITTLLPDLKAERLDRDMLTSSTRLSSLLDRFRSGQFDTLIGTQILSKGHDFPRVSLVVILHLEDALFLPDFRSAERTYQLLLQSAGRAGRGDVPGRVVIQSLQGSHPVLLAVTQNLGQAFYRDELALRKLAGLPPFVRQILIELENTDENILSKDSFAVRKAIEEHLSSTIKSNTDQSLQPVRIIGPHPAPVEKLNGNWRSQLCLSALKSIHPKLLIPEILHADRFGHCKIRVDVDPYGFM